MNKQVSFTDEPLILVDTDGNPVGSMPKLECHLGQGTLHRAFSVFLFNNKNELLLQQRSADKMLWPSFWSNSCCSHPRLGEDEATAVHRRVAEELGIPCIDELTKHFEFEYQASYLDVGSEWELCSVLTARCDQSPRVNSNEISATRWVSIDQLSPLLQADAERFTPWIKLEWKRLLPLLQNKFLAV